jgi:hypothetical protein
VKKTVWLGVLFCTAVVAYLVSSSFRPKAYRVNVCITFRGARDCRTASADTRDEALRTATTNACAQLAGGVTMTGQCENTPPDSVEWLK